MEPAMGREAGRAGHGLTVRSWEVSISPTPSHHFPVRNSKKSKNSKFKPNFPVLGSFEELKGWWYRWHYGQSRTGWEEEKPCGTWRVGFPLCSCPRSYVCAREEPCTWIFLQGQGIESCHEMLKHLKKSEPQWKELKTKRTPEQKLEVPSFSPFSSTDRLDEFR